ncbi:PREDICTED: EF-hand domain-containing family member B-like [Dinoponera quadriceps]|uniref:EF-hand domain-containing family member B-like n=1 Tax=Dinoponera quadriceps TaxID=609295 RepID=A0A6P3YFJ8_DINQU|nr:PREDICTED: EF-hand domain-containing family member B-like [Dinoponera quadriceps]
MPVLPKMQQASSASSDYVTTYGDSIGNISTFDDTQVHAAGLPSARSNRPSMMLIRADVSSKKDLDDQTAIHCSIPPDIFTKHGLTRTDLFMARNKEEIRSIFEDVGFKFPKNSFDSLWQEALLKDRTGGVCVETFRQLLVVSGCCAAKEETCE